MSLYQRPEGEGVSHVLVLADLVTGVVAPAVGLLVEYGVLTGKGAFLVTAIVGLLTRFARTYRPARKEPKPAEPEHDRLFRLADIAEANGQSEIAAGIRAKGQEALQAAHDAERSTVTLQRLPYKPCPECAVERRPSCDSCAGVGRVTEA